MNSSTAVSVVVPVYNVAPYLPQCVESLLTQSHEALEILLVDDGATDDSGALCDRYAREDPRVRVIHQSNRGLSGARNAGLAMASADYIAFIDGDDWMDRAGVEQQLAVMDDPSVDVVVSGYHVDVIDREGRTTTHERRPPQVTVDTGGVGLGPRPGDLTPFVGYAWNKLYRRSHIESMSARFVEGVSLVEDVLFNGPVLGQARKTVFVDEAYVHYVQRERDTLGTSVGPHFAQLVVVAGACLEDLMQAWGVDGATARSTARAAELGRVQWAVRGLALRSSPSWQCASDVADLMRVPEVHELIATERRRRGTRDVHDMLLWTQAARWGWPSVWAHRLRRRFR